MANFQKWFLVLIGIKSLWILLIYQIVHVSRLIFLFSAFFFIIVMTTKYLREYHLIILSVIFYLFLAFDIVVVNLDCLCLIQ